MYDVEETCHDNNNTKYCPILLKVKDEFIMNELGVDEKGKQYKYLLQVWMKAGFLVYERKMV